MHAFPENGGVYFETESVIDASDQTDRKTEMALRDKLISDVFQAVKRGHGPRNGIWNDPESFCWRIAALTRRQKIFYETLNKMHVDTKSNYNLYKSGEMGKASVSTSHYQVRESWADITTHVVTTILLSCCLLWLLTFCGRLNWKGSWQVVTLSWD